MLLFFRSIFVLFSIIIFLIPLVESPAHFVARQQACIQIAAAIYTQARLRTSLFCFLLYQLSLWWVKYRAQPEAISTWNHAGRNAPWQAETGWGEKVKPRKPAWNQAFLWLPICGCQVRNKNFCKKISLSEPKLIRFQTQKDFSCYFFDLSFSLLLDVW